MMLSDGLPGLIINIDRKDEIKTGGGYGLVKIKDFIKSIQWRSSLNRTFNLRLALEVLMIDLPKEEK